VSNVAAAAAGPNSKVKPTPSCVPTPDGAAVVVRRPIAADNSCLFNAVGYTMHHSTNRAPFLRQVVSREVSSDPQVRALCWAACWTRPLLLLLLCEEQWAAAVLGALATRSCIHAPLGTQRPGLT
jgi:ubiquitin thioesterase OTU1